jgi:hypothetical protein
MIFRDCDHERTARPMPDLDIVGMMKALPSGEINRGDGMLRPLPRSGGIRGSRRGVINRATPAVDRVAGSCRGGVAVKGGPYV